MAKAIFNVAPPHTHAYPGARLDGVQELTESEALAPRSRGHGDAKALRKQFNAAVERAELEDSVARAKRASQGGTYDGLRSVEVLAMIGLFGQ